MKNDCNIENMFKHSMLYANLQENLWWHEYMLLIALSG